MTKKITGDNITTSNAAWSFESEDVCNAFDEHVKKSVPLYFEGQMLLLSMSDFFIDYGSKIYDLGCSTGTLTRNLFARHSHKSVSVYGIDPSEPMIEKAKKNDPDGDCEYICADAFDIDMTGADLITSYYTIQFIRPHMRQSFIDKIFSELRWGGAFFMYEKVRAPDARFQDIFSASYVEYKQNMGYSDEEILGKQVSLKGILEPFSTNGNLDMLKRAGFKDIVSVFKYAPFEGFLCVK